MIRKFGYGLIVAGALMLGVVVVNSVSVSTAIAKEAKKVAKEVKCDKCGDFPSKPHEGCECACHKPAPKK